MYYPGRLVRITMISTIILVVLGLIILAALWYLVKNVMHLVINSILGLILLVIINGSSSLFHYRKTWDSDRFHLCHRPVLLPGSPELFCW